MPGWEGILGIWLLGGILALAGSLSYAELATAYPYEGGDYVYQTRAFGRWAGYLFGWSQLAVIRPGDIALMAFVFARYAAALYAPFDHARPVYALAAVAALTFLNVLGVREGKWTQNLLTVIKFAGLLAIAAGGLWAPHPAPAAAPAPAFDMGGFNLALILVLFTFGGWNEMAYVSAEVERPERNIVRALAIGTVLVTAVYLGLNGAFLYALGREGMASSQAIAVDAVKQALPGGAERGIAVIICISALGAVNGLIFTGARISYAMGREHALFRGLGKWNARSGTPVWALLVQGGLSAAIILVAGSFVDTILYTAPVVWLFFLATGVSVFVLRAREPAVLRPYRVVGYPWTPLVFCLCCAFMLYSSVAYAMAARPAGLCMVLSVLAAGYILFLRTEGRSAGRGSCGPDGR
jgi:amino acid transporter